MKTYQLQNEAVGSRPVQYSQSAYAAAGARISLFSTAPAPEIVDDRLGKCAANDNTCNAFHTKNSQLCMGHQRSKKVTE